MPSTSATSATAEKISVLDTLAVQALGGVLMKRQLGVHYVGITVEEGDWWVYFRMPSGEMRMELTKSSDGNPVRLENQTLPFLSNVKAAHSPFWCWSDDDRHFEYRNRCGKRGGIFAWPQGQRDEVTGECNYRRPCSTRGSRQESCSRR